MPITQCSNITMHIIACQFPMKNEGHLASSLLRYDKMLFISREYDALMLDFAMVKHKYQPANPHVSVDRKPQKPSASIVMVIILRVMRACDKW